MLNTNGSAKGGQAGGRTRPPSQQGFFPCGRGEVWGGKTAALE